MRTILTALILTIATQAGAECGNLCDHYWWKTTTEADLQAELDAGADFMARTNYGDTPLHRVSSSGNSLFIIALLDAGADVMARDNGGNTPLHETAGCGSPDNIQALLDAGTKINARANDGSTPLLTATAFGTLANIKALLDAGADVMARDNGGRTPRHWAVTCHLSPVTCQFGCELGRLQVLLAASADAKSKDKEGKTPCDLAQKNEDLKGTKAYWALKDAQYN